MTSKIIIIIKNNDALAGILDTCHVIKMPEACTGKRVFSRHRHTCSISDGPTVLLTSATVETIDLVDTRRSSCGASDFVEEDVAVALEDDDEIFFERRR